MWYLQTDDFRKPEILFLFDTSLAFFQNNWVKTETFMLYLLHLSMCLLRQCLLFVWYIPYRILYSKKQSKENFARFCGLIACTFCQPLSCFTRDSQKSLVVAIYSPIKSRSCQDIIKILSFITDIVKARLSVFYYCI